MAQVSKIDSNATGLRYAEEATIGVLPGSPVWRPLEPNSYDDFGGDIETVARDPIADDRQYKKGLVTNVVAQGGFESDLTPNNLQDILQGFFFADARDKGTVTATSVTTTYNGAAGFDAFAAGDLAVGLGFNEAGNNGLKNVTGSTATTLTVSQTLVAEASPPDVATVVRVGVQAASSDVDVDASGSLPAYTSSTLDFTDLGLSPGEWIFVGGDTAGTFFGTNPENNGFKRVHSVSANELVVDKSPAGAMVTEASSGTIQIFIPRTLKNETGTLIKRRTYQLERTLGAPDDASPSQIQSEYLTGQVANEFTLTAGVADKVVCSLGFVGLDNEVRDGATGVKSGTRLGILEQDAFNTSSDFPVMRMAVVSADETATPLFGFLTDLEISISNNAEINQALGVLGGFEVTVGKFEVSGSVTAYFSNISAITALKSNSNVSLDAAIVGDNAGVVIDLPLMTLGGGRITVEQDQPITLPISFTAASGAQVKSTLDHTMLMSFFDYLPDLAKA